MARFVFRRLLTLIPTLLVISIISFIVIQLPPGDWLSTYVMQLAQSGTLVDQAELLALERRYAMGQPMHIQYFRWISRVVRGDFGMSFEYGQPVRELIQERLLLTVFISFCSLIFSWVVAFPIGIYSAVKQHSMGDYAATFVGFLGLSTPNFMIALVLMYVAMQHFGLSVGGLFSPEYVRAPWSAARFFDMLKNLWLPVIIVGTSGTATLIRVLRNNLLDELQKQYVVTARAKGVHAVRLTLKYPVRMALIPFVSVAGWQLPELVSGEMITAVVLSLPTTGPLLLSALLAQDMYLAGGFILLLAVLMVIGTLLSDILLALVDPRIRYE